MRNLKALFTLLAIFCIAGNLAALPPAYNGKIIIEDKVVNSGTSFTVKVILDNSDQNITSLKIPLKFNNTYLTCNYVDFTGSLAHPSMQTKYRISGNQVEIAYVPPVINPLPSISSDSGLVATLYFTVAGNTPDMTTLIDSFRTDFQFSQFGVEFHQWTRVEATTNDGSGILAPLFDVGSIVVHRTTGVDDDNRVLPGSFVLAQNYPNPFNPVTTIQFSLSDRAYVRLDILNILGETVAVLAEGEFAAGTHSVNWDASDISSGVYFYRLNAGGMIDAKKMLLLK